MKLNSGVVVVVVVAGKRSLFHYGGIREVKGHGVHMTSWGTRRCQHGHWAGKRQTALPEGVVPQVRLLGCPVMSGSKLEPGSMVSAP